jgi:MinD-like ATPase involved in chromosome partitioning or flagellar assembly
MKAYTEDAYYKDMDTLISYMDINSNSRSTDSNNKIYDLVMGEIKLPDSVINSLEDGSPRNFWSFFDQSNQEINNVKQIIDENPVFNRLSAITENRPQGILELIKYILTNIFAKLSNGLEFVWDLIRSKFSDAITAVHNLYSKLIETKPYNPTHESKSLLESFQMITIAGIPLSVILLWGSVATVMIGTVYGIVKWLSEKTLDNTAEGFVITDKDKKILTNNILSESVVQNKSKNHIKKMMNDLKHIEKNHKEINADSIVDKKLVKETWALLGFLNTWVLKPTIKYAGNYLKKKIEKHLNPEEREEGKTFKDVLLYNYIEFLKLFGIIFVIVNIVQAFTDMLF